MMRKFILAATAVAVLAVPAFAADMAVKAVPAPIGYPYAQSGFYFGVGASASAQSASVANTGVVSAGAGLDGVVGYQWKGGLDFIALEVIGTYDNVGNSQACAAVGGAITGCSLGSTFEIDPRVKFGFPIQTVLSVLPNLSSYFPALPALPAGITASNEHPYVFVGAPLRDVSANYGLMTGREWTAQVEVGLGLLSQWQSGLVADISAGCALNSVGIQLGPIPSSAKLGTSCQTRLAILY